MSLEKSLKEFADHKDTALLLAAVREAIDGEGAEHVSEFFLHPQYNEIVHEVAWDLLSMMSPHLTSPDSRTASLISHIAEVGVPKELCLAFLEVLEEVSSLRLLMFLFGPIRTILRKISKNEKLLSSTLKSIRLFIQRGCMALKSNMERLSRQKLGINSNEDEQFDEETTTGLTTAGVTPVSLTLSTVDFLQPPLDLINGYYCSFNGAVPHTGWTSLQQACIGILTDVLGTVMVCNVTEEEEEEEEVIVRVVECVKLCHCGGFRFLEWQQIERRRLDENPEDVFLVADNIAILCCLLLKGMGGYLPAVLSNEYRLRTGVVHIGHILDQYGVSSERLSLMALSVLESLLEKVSHQSLSLAALEEPVYKRSLLIMCQTMTSSPKAPVRQKAVSLLNPFIDLFEARGRYKVYEMLLREVTHSGVKGLLVQKLKDEVNNSLTLELRESSCFIGEELKGLYRQFLAVSQDSDVLVEYDRYMSGLNFLRFLLLKDSPESNKTLIWNDKDRLNENFLRPLRASLTTTNMYCKSLLENPEERERQRKVSSKEQLKLDVTVLGEDKVPDISEEEEVKVLNGSLLRLDIMMSVLSRVEELFNQR